MNFETYDPTKHTLEVGRKIRLGGREGEIILTDSEGGELGYQVEWEKLTHSYLDLSAYPLLEITVSPLTIDKRVKEEIEKRLIQTNGWGLQDKGMFLEGKIKDIFDYIGSLEET